MQSIHLCGIKVIRIKVWPKISDERECHENLERTEKDERSAGKVSKKFQSKFQDWGLQFFFNE